MPEAVTSAPLRRQILTALIENKEGMTRIGLAALLGLKRKAVSEQLALLSLDDEAIIDRINYLHQSIWVVTMKGEKGFIDQRFAAKERKCMTCTKPFWSSHAGNRICPDCTPQGSELE
jgi:hypothetical protein